MALNEDTILRSIESMNTRAVTKFRVIRLMRFGKAVIKSLRYSDNSYIKNVPIVPSNAGYGHEFWLKKYAGYHEAIFAAIEHGVYFGKNTSPLVNPIVEESEIGSFITYGQYRARLLASAYNAHNVFPIGPYIQYAQTNEAYKNDILSQLSSGRVLTLMPAHSVANGKTLFDHASLASTARQLSYTLDCPNLLVCISPNDYEERLVKTYKTHGFHVVTSGKNPILFLANQRAIYECSSITVSNDLGTNLGYSLCMNVPHIIINPIPLSERVEGNCIPPGAEPKAFEEERQQFFKSFSQKRLSDSLDSEQQELYKEYWGDALLSSVEMKEIFVRCKASFLQRTKEQIIDGYSDSVLVDHGSNRR